MTLKCTLRTKSTALQDGAIEGMVLKPALSEPIGIPASNAPGAAPLEGELVGSNARSRG